MRLGVSVRLDSSHGPVEGMPELHIGWNSGKMPTSKARDTADGSKRLFDTESVQRCLLDC